MRQSFRFPFTRRGLNGIEVSGCLKFLQLRIAHLRLDSSTINNIVYNASFVGASSARENRPRPGGDLYQSTVRIAKEQLTDREGGRDAIESLDSKIRSLFGRLIPIDEFSLRAYGAAMNGCSIKLWSSRIRLASELRPITAVWAFALFQ